MVMLLWNSIKHMHKESPTYNREQQGWIKWYNMTSS